MKRKISLCFLLFLFLCTLQYTGIAQNKKQFSKPNVIIILMDDMGYGDPTCYNGMSYQTPLIDQLAAEGMRFTNFYAAQPVCSASRAGLLTGCYPNRIGIAGALMPWAPNALNPKEETIASLLKKVGYSTAMVGKWHLGSKAPSLPVHFGFDDFFGLPYSNDMWPVNYDGKPITNSKDNRSKYPPLQLLNGDTPGKHIATLDDQGTLTKSYTEHAVDFIKKNKQHPFFLYFAHSMVHVPIAASPAFKGKSKEGLFGDVMMEVDWSVGQIMKTLRETGIDKNTIVVFTSDNGPWLTFGNHAGNTNGLREGKGTSWEGGQRVPCIVRWPAKVPAGTVCNKLSVGIDLLPTIAEVCGASLPKEKIDGVNILPLWLNKTDANPRDELAYYYHHNDLCAVRKGEWKLVFPHPFTSMRDSVGRDGFPGKYYRDTATYALYNLRFDPGEERDLKGQYPDVVKQLEAVAAKYREMLGDDLTKTPCKECREAAKVN